MPRDPGAPMASGWAGLTMGDPQEQPGTTTNSAAAMGCGVVMMALVGVGAFTWMQFRVDSREAAALRREEAERGDRGAWEERTRDARASTARDLMDFVREEQNLAREAAELFPAPRTLDTDYTAPASRTPRADSLLRRRDELARRRAELAAQSSAPLDREPPELAFSSLFDRLQRARTRRELLDLHGAFDESAPAYADRPEPLIGMGVAAARAGFLTSATLHLERAAERAAEQGGERSPGYRAAVRLLADALRRMPERAADGAAIRERFLAIERDIQLEELNETATLATEMGDARAGLAWTSATLLLGDSNPALPESLGLGAAELLGRQLLDLGRFQQAQPYIERALRGRAALEGEASPGVADLRRTAAQLYRRTMRFDEAQRQLEQGLAALEGSLGAGHPAATPLLKDLAELQVARGFPSEALPHLQAAHAILKDTLGADHPDTLAAALELARLSERLGELDTARARYQEILAAQEAAYGPGHPDVAESLAKLSSLARAAGDREEAVELLRRRERSRAAALGDDSPLLAEDRAAIARALFEAGRAGEAEPLARAALATQERALGLDHPSVAETLRLLASATIVSGGPDARALALRSYQARLRAGGPDRHELSVDLFNLGLVASNEGLHGEATVYFRRSLELLSKHLGPDAPALGEHVVELQDSLSRTMATDAARRDVLRLGDWLQRRAREAAVPATQRTLADGEGGVLRQMTEAVANMTPPRTQLVRKLLRRGVVLAELAEMPSDDPFRREFLAPMLEQYGMNEEAETLARDTAATRREVYPTRDASAPYDVVSSTLDRIGGRVDWPAEVPSVRNWSLDGLELRGRDLQEQVDAMIERARETPPGP
ncbi:MAG: tetratricopeptide repeat protein [Candidatus Sumerlaeia bacterium]|nr:tetratricopeptide repeat protein [Candidatus Sumerlaeia bacterium]